MSSSPTETFVDVTMPQMGVSVAEGTVVEWKKQPGDWVERDEIIASISTDKIDTDVEAPASGRVQEILVEVGTTVDVGVVMARIATDAKPGEAHASEELLGGHLGGRGRARGAGRGRRAVRRHDRRARRDGPAGHAGGPPVAARAATRRSSCGSPPSTGSTSKTCRAQAAEAGCASRTCSPTWSRGNGAAVEEPPMHIESPYKPEPVAKKAVAESAPRPRPGQPLSRMRQSIGKAMIDSLQTAATCTTIIEADLTRIASDREKTGLTWLPYVARATIETLREFPSLNATLEGETFTQYDAVNLGIAVSLGEGGLIVPVIRDAQNLSVEGLGKEIKALARKARDNQLTPDDVRGGTFTITNPGGYGSIMATPVINQPQVAILDTEAVVKRPVVVTDEHGDDSIAIRHMTYLCMSWDHRALDGALAAQFLAALRGRLES